MPRGRKKKFKLDLNVKPETIRSIIALVLLLFAVIGLISFFAPDYSVNAKVQRLMKTNFGYTSILLPFLAGIAGLLLIPSIKAKIKEPRIVIGLILFLLGMSGLLHVFVSAPDAYKVAMSGAWGGLVGYKISSFLSGAVSIYGAFVLLLIVVLVSLFLLFDLSFETLAGVVSKIAPSVKLSNLLPFKFAKKNLGDSDMEDEFEFSSGVPQASMAEADSYSASYEPDTDEEPAFQVIPSLSEPTINARIPDVSAVSTLASSSTSATSLDFMRLPQDRIWQEPSLDLLLEPPMEIKENTDTDKRSKIIKETLKSFGIEVEIVDVKIGSSVTQYSLQTKSVTKVSKIASLHEDIAMALASPTGSVRIEAPIPGKPYIGIEVPNVNRSLVYFKSLITSEPMKGIKSKLAIGLGKDVGGRTYVYDIAKMPHLLIAGATGSGKSIFIHNILFSILFRASPQEVKFILVDPKRVELIYYQDIPHLLTPVVVDMDKAPSVFKWAVDEMEKRYKLFEQAKVKNIEAYNEKSGIQVMPYIVLIVDELAEIMVRDPQGVEKSIIRLAQLARATGIHLVLAVQRPSTNVITGLIKANIPTRVAFNVTSQIDSRVILDQPGAEKLLGKGDMLFIPPDVQKPVRLQASYISDKEIANLVNYLKTQGVEPDYRDDVLHMPSDRGTKGSGSQVWGDDVDELFDEALEIVTVAGKASASLLQRKLSIGYARAARIIDDMEDKGIIGPAMGGSKTRDILYEGFNSRDARDPRDPMPVDSLD